MPCYETKGNICMPLKIRFVGLFVNAGYRKVNLELWSKKRLAAGVIFLCCAVHAGLNQKSCLMNTVN